ncbi:hypothetical protein J7M00_05845 [bacterium]|nr:hypothetical protein [bacterium]
MSIVKSAFFAVIKVFWKGVWGKALFQKKRSASPSTLRGALGFAPCRRLYRACLIDKRSA